MTFIYVQFCDFSKFTFFHLLWLYLWLFKGKFCDYMWWIATFFISVLYDFIVQNIMSSLLLLCYNLMIMNDHE